jgi:hypothetical protein
MRNVCLDQALDTGALARKQLYIAVLKVSYGLLPETTSFHLLGAKRIRDVF